MKTKQKYVYLVSQGKNFRDGYILCVFRRKKDAEKFCRKDGFRYCSSDDLFCGKLHGQNYWRSVRTTEYYLEEKQEGYDG